MIKWDRAQNILVPRDVQFVPVFVIFGVKTAPDGTKDNGNAIFCPSHYISYTTSGT